MNFKTKKISTQTLSEYLAAIRSKLGFSPAEVARLIQVQPKYIFALEESRFSDLPADVYVKGYLRGLAKLYRVSATELIEQFEAEKGIEENVVEEEPRPQKDNSPNLSGFVFTPRNITIIGAAILGLASLGYLVFQVNSISAAPALDLASPSGDGVVEESLILVRGQTETGAKVFINNQPIVVDADGNFVQQLSLAPGSNQLEIKAENEFGNETLITRSIVFQNKQVAGSFTVGPEDSTGVPGVDPETVSTGEAEGEAEELSVGSGNESQFSFVITAEEEAAWVEVTVDGELFYSGTMLPGSRQAVDASQQVSLTTGNAGATRVLIDGVRQDRLGEFGQVVRDLVFGEE